MDIYDFLKEKIGKFDQKKLFKYAIIFAIIAIILIIIFLIYINKMANEKKHALDPTGIITNKKIEKEKVRQEQYLENPTVKEIYQKYFVEGNFSF